MEQTVFSVVNAMISKKELVAQLGKWMSPHMDFGGNVESRELRELKSNSNK